MNFWTAIVVIAVIWGIVALVRSRQNATIGYATDDEGRLVGNPQREEELQIEVEQLRERIQVLERIATEDRTADRLTDEIEKLRDKE